MADLSLLAAGPGHLGGYLVIGALLFASGVLACAVRRNAVGFLMGIELMLNGAALTIVAFARFRAEPTADGQVFTLFVIALAAAEAAVALALVYALARTRGDVDLEPPQDAA